ncbi:6 TM domain-containing transmembrane protein [Acrasis kona]|uniref:6 TM domain-containing transmembrane protein n=1 Tax=Acrasis kona TaxID=1008807 RepID=A0AAW2ZCD2_9EUKA
MIQRIRNISQRVSRTILTRRIHSNVKGNKSKFEPIVEGDLKQKPSLQTIFAVVAASISITAVGSLIDFDGYEDSLILKDQEAQSKAPLYSLANAGITVYSVVRLYERGILNLFAKFVSDFSEKKTSNLYCVQFLSTACQNRTLCYRLVTETNILEDLFKILNEPEMLPPAIVVSSVIRTLKHASSIPQAQAILIREIDTLQRVSNLKNKDISDDLNEIMSNIVLFNSNTTSTQNERIINVIYPMTRSERTSTSSLALKSCQAVVERGLDRPSTHQEFTKDIEKFKSDYDLCTFGSNLLTFGAVGFFYSLVRHSVQAVRISKAATPIGLILKLAFKTSLITAGLGVAPTLMISATNQFNKKQVISDINILREDALRLEVASKAVQLLLPILALLISYRVPYTVAPFVLSMLMTRTEPFEFLLRLMYNPGQMKVKLGPHLTVVKNVENK